MALFLISILVIAAVIAAMAIGVLAGRAPIKGSCGGIGALGLNASCEICGGNAQRCDEKSRSIDAAATRKCQVGVYTPASR
jgi:hypothetical protein